MPRCCYIDEATGIGCPENAEFRLTDSPKDTDYTESCRTHVGALLRDNVAVDVRPISWMTTEPSMAEVEAALAQRFEALRDPCPIQKQGYERRDDCYWCHGLGYVPACTTDALLQVCAQQKYYMIEVWPPVETKPEPWEVDIEEVEGRLPKHGEGTTHREALARALYATDSGKDKRA